MGFCGGRGFQIDNEKFLFKFVFKCCKIRFIYLELSDTGCHQIDKLKDTFVFRLNILDG